MKKYLFLLLLLALTLALAACGTQPEQPIDQDPNANTDVNQDYITIVDQGGYEVTVPTDIDRIAVAGIYPLPSVLTLFFNSAEKIVAMPKASYTAAENGLLSQLYPEILDVETDCVSGETINTEELLLLEPDVVFYSSADAQVGEQLRNAGFATVGVSASINDYNCILTLNSWIELLSEMFPENGRADQAEAYSQDIYDLVQERVSQLSLEEKKQVFFLFQYNDSLMMTSGSSFFGQWWCDAVNAINVGQEIATDNAVSVNLEQVYDWNPDVILITNFTTAQPSDLYNNTIGSYDWSGIQAVADKQVYKMPLGMYRSYTAGADTPITLLWIAQTLYPELFSDIDIIQEAQKYYEEVFDITLTADQLNSIFAPPAASGEGVVL